MRNIFLKRIVLVHGFGWGRGPVTQANEQCETISFFVAVAPLTGPFTAAVLSPCVLRVLTTLGRTVIFVNNNYVRCTTTNERKRCRHPLNLQCLFSFISDCCSLLRLSKLPRSTFVACLVVFWEVPTITTKM